MKKQLSVLLIALMGLTYYGYGQDKPEQKFGITWGGFVKADYMADTRQNVTSREGHFLLFPSAENIVGGKDLNGVANFNILAVQSRLTGKISGPDFFGMKTSGVIEADFFGNSGTGLDDVNGFRLRHAYVKLSNDKVEILMGQYWHPMFVTAVFPGTYSFNTGVPFQPFSRNPQFRITTKGKVQFIGVLFSERDFASRGPAGTISTYVRNAFLPQLHTQLQFVGKESLGGIGVNLKTLRMTLADNTVSNTSFISYFKTKMGKTTFKLEGIYGENMSDILAISGIAEAAGGGYTSNRTFTVWGELSGGDEHSEWGIFSGYTKNNGFKEATVGPIWGLAPTMDNVFRIAPRYGWKSGKMTIGLEVEYTTALYGTLAANKMDIDTAGKKSVGNLRTALSAIYGF